jgi:uncharacterized protein YjdB
MKRMTSHVLALCMAVMSTSTCTDAGPAAPPMQAGDGAARIQVQPRTLDIVVEQTYALKATTIADDGSFVPSTDIKWSTSDAAIAKVSADGIAVAVGPGTTSITASKGWRRDSVLVTVRQRPLTRVVAVHKAVTLTAIGAKRQLMAHALNDGGQVMTAPLSWQSLNNEVADVDNVGVVTARAVGTALVVVRAVCCVVADTVVVQVNQAVHAVMVTPAAATLNQAQQLQVEVGVIDASGNPVTGRPAMWSSNNTAVATVSSEGVVQTRQPGLVRITASVDGVSGHSNLVVHSVPVATIIPSPAALELEVGKTAQVTAIAHDATGEVLSGVQYAFSSSNSAVATVNQSGVVTGTGEGSGEVTLSRDGVTATVPVTVRGLPVATVAVTPATASFHVGATQQLNVTLRDAGGGVITGRQLVWTSSAPQVAQVSSTGVVTGLAPGGAVITAASEGRAGQANVTVTAVPPPPPAQVAVVSVSPSTPSVQIGATAQLTAALSDAAGNTLTGRTVSWSSGQPGIATVNGTGVVTGTAAGTATITATSEGQSAQVSVTVTAAPPAAVAVVSLSPSAPSVQAGATAQLTAALSDAAGNTLTGRTVSWSSGQPGIATVNGTGVVTGTAAGTATVTATSEGKSAQVTVTVTSPPPAPVAVVSLSPSAPSVQVGGTVQLTAALSDAAGNPLAGRAISWSSGQPGIATVNGTGVVTGVAAGTATVTATSEGKSAQVAVSVQAPSAGTFVISASIKADCSTDVTQALMDWIASVPNGSTLQFGAGACYDVTEGLRIGARHGLTFEGNGATFQAGFSDTSNRMHFNFTGGASGIIIRNMTLIGPNATAGISGPYYSSIESQHGIGMRGTQGMTIEDVTVRQVFGDCVYTGGGSTPTRNLVVRRLHCEGTGRHGVGLTNNIGVLVEDSYFSGIRWSGVDVEPGVVGNHGLDITIRNNRFGPVRHYLLTVGGKSGWPYVGRIAFNHNVQEGYAENCTEAIRFSGSSDGTNRHQFEAVGNRILSYCGSWIRVHWITDVLIADNHLSDPRNRNENKSIRLRDSHNVTIRNNNLGPRTVWVLYEDDKSTNVVVQN